MDRSHGVGALLSTAVLLLAVTTARGQDAQPVDQNPSDVFFPSHDAARRLSQAREALAAKQFNEAIQWLNLVLESGEDQWVKTGSGFAGAKAEADRMMSSMPAGGHAAFEFLHGVEARRKLDAAASKGDLPELAAVARQFFYTSAGKEATLLLARHNLSRGQPLAAASQLMRLVKLPEDARRFEPALSVMLAASYSAAGMPEQAHAALVALKKRMPDAALRVAGKEVQLFEHEAEALSWLATVVAAPKQSASRSSTNWAMFRGDATRNAMARGGRPLLSARWSTPVSHEPDLVQALAQRQRRYSEQGISPIPASHPLAVDNLVLTRTPTGLLAVDLKTGKRLWNVNDPIDLNDAEGNWVPPRGRIVTADHLRLLRLDRRAWENVARGTLSSDNSSVFAVSRETTRELGEVDNSPTNAAEPTGPFEVLSAYDIRSGKRRWSVGGKTGGDESRLASVSFLGPPLPLNGELFAIAEVQGEVRLVVLEATTGAMRWWQHLAQVGHLTDESLERRYFGASPSFHAGVLVCPTSAGAVIGVDPDSRALLWGRRYLRTDDRQGGPSRGFGAFRIRHNEPKEGLAEGWADGLATIAGERVLITPRDAGDLLCLDLKTGERLWKIARGENLYLGGVHNGSAILVGKRQVTAVKLDGGKPAWSGGAGALPAGASPAGRGFLTGDDYYIPLSTGQIARVNLGGGELQVVGQTPRGENLGNLICYEDQLVSQAADQVAAFYQLEPRTEHVTKLLSENINDPAALAGRGELHLSEGRIAEAVDDLRRSYQITPEAHTRSLLIAALQALLQDKFEPSLASLDELKQLAELPEEQAAAYRIAAAGYLAGSQLREAAAALMGLYQLPESPRPEELRGNHWVRRDRWVSTQWAEILRVADADDREHINRLVQSQFAAVMTRLDAKQTSSESIEKFINFFGNHSVADEAKRELAQRLSGGETLLKREQLLLELSRSPDRAKAGAAVARLAQLMIEAERPSEAAQHYASLATTFSDQVCLDDRTGAQLVEELATDSPVRRLMSAPEQWSLGRVKSEKIINKEHPLGLQTQLGSLALQNPESSAIAGLQIVYDQRGEVVGRDGKGHQRWVISLEGESTNPGGPVNTHPHLNKSVANGHLVMAVVGTELFALDTLRSPGASGSRVLWHQELITSLGGIDERMTYAPSMQPTEVHTEWGQRKYINSGLTPHLGRLGPLTRHGVCVQRGFQLLMIDHLSGDELWSRSGIPASSELLGDDEVLIAIPPNSTEALVLRTSDGELIGKRKAPPFEKRWAAIGRLMLAWKPQGERTRLVLLDISAGTEKVLGDFATGSKAAIIPGEVAAVLEPTSGRFVLLSLPDGMIQIDSVLAPEPRLASIFLLKDASSYFLLTSGVPPEDKGPVRRSVRAAFHELSNPIVSGRLYAFDRDTGEQRWPAAASIHQHGILLDAPVESPCFVFARRVQETFPKTGVLKSSILCIDKRDGRVVYYSEDLQHFNNVELRTDASARTFSLIMPTQTVVLSFTDEPVPPEPPAQTDPQAEQQATVLRKPSKAQSVFGAILRGVSELNGRPAGLQKVDDDD